MALLFRRGPAPDAAVGSRVCAAAGTAWQHSGRGHHDAVTANGSYLVRAVRAHAATDAL